VGGVARTNTPTAEDFRWLATDNGSFFVRPEPKGGESSAAHGDKSSSRVIKETGDPGEDGAEGRKISIILRTSCSVIPRDGFV